MTETVELILLVVLLAGYAAIFGRRALAAAGRLEGRESDARLACPKTGADVDCVLVHDDARERVACVRACSAFPDGVPRCDQDCAKLLNLGIPLRPARPREG